MLCAVCAVAVQLDRDYIRALREVGTPMPKIGRTVTIDTGKNAGNHPSVASQSACAALLREHRGDTSRHSTSGRF